MREGVGPGQEWPIQAVDLALLGSTFHNLLQETEAQEWRQLSKRQENHNLEEVQIIF